MFWMKEGLKWSLIRFIGGSLLFLWILSKDAIPLIWIILILAWLLEFRHLLITVKKYKGKK